MGVTHRHRRRGTGSTAATAAPPQASATAYPQRTDGTAIAALVLAIAAFVVCPVIPAVIALALIPGARRSITVSGGTVGGLGVLTAAKIIAWVNLGLALFFLGAVIIAAISSSTSSQNALAGAQLVRAWAVR